MASLRHVCIVSVLAGSLLSGCAALQELNIVEKPEDEVARLAQQQFDFMRAGEFDKAYVLMSPGYRALKSESAYKMDNRGARRWQTADVTQVTCQEERCNVFAEITLTEPASGPQMRPSQMRPAGERASITMNMEQLWLKTGEGWRKSRNL
ncbi:hypothetical protein [Halopseudomonas salegens]|uniref:DUF4440 domain-containing protein n=1 Tax=Halopseudomonas salegens TaxID=1434072 RepID=A0A1H2HWR5_9GAMM|nr:hypothetical protein [Halopseudomonas salegens]SDU36224.1 hypothetical protein SAMN05216210_3367 [Halopseudomonas salegens]